MPTTVPASPLSKDEWSNPLWRLSNIYHVTDENGRDFRFSPNEEQLDFYHQLWYRNVILKARQLGFTTWIDLIALDQCLFNETFTSVIIANDLDNAGKIFRNKVQYPYEKLPPGLLERIPLKTKTQSKELYFRNGSSVSVTTSARGGTTQFLHVSELGKIARRFPQKSKEIISGSFESVPADGIICVESTAEGNAGDFFDMVEEALKLRDTNGVRTQLDFKLHFYPWYKKNAYQIDPRGIPFTEEDHRYFDKLERMLGIKLSLAQRAWYVVKRRTVKAEMAREYPATPAEAFAQAVDGAIYAEEMAQLRNLGRIGKVPIVERLPVNTFWDLGASAGNATAIWLHQRVGSRDRFVGFLQGEGKGMRHFWGELLKIQAQHGFRWGVHHLPHDGKARLQGAELQSRIEVLESLQMETCDNVRGYHAGEVVAVPRTQDLGLAIDATKDKLLEVEIDEEACAEGIRALENYQYEFIEAQGRYSKTPLHNWCSNPADAFRQWAQGYEPETAQDRARSGAGSSESNYPRGAY